MALSAPRINFGIHSIAPYARATKTIGDTTFYKGQPFGLFQVLGDASFSLPATSIPLFGGSSLHAWTSELVQIASEIYSVFAGADVALTAASATGTIVALVNVEGTSVQSATTGITTATIKSGSETDLKFNKYVVVAKSTTTVDVYAMTDLQFANATALTYQDDALKITASPLTIETDTAVEVPNTGVELTGGSGTIALVANDTAVYHTTAAHGGISTIDIGKKGINFPEHGLLMYGKERSDGTLFQLEIYKARVSAGIVLPMSEGDFQITDVTVRALIDSAPIDGSGVAKVATMKAVAPV
jgi:hypothetical protein